LPRLAAVFYQGDAVVHWSLNIEDRKTGWLTESFHQAFRELMIHTAAREHMLCPTYCLMPDHMHIVWMGLDTGSDQRRGMAFLRTFLSKALSPWKLQHQAYDHVLGDEERRRNAFAKVCAYILNNPVRAELVSDASAWKFTGAVVPGYPELHPAREEFWGTFWQLDGKLRQPTGGRALPRRSSSTPGGKARSVG
jgi:putative transposase